MGSTFSAAFLVERSSALYTWASSICALDQFGWPDSYIRPGWEIFTLVFHAFCGALAGLLFGGCLVAFARATGARIPIPALALGTILVAIPLYTVCVYLSVKYRKLVSPLLPDAFVSVCGLAIARLLAKRAGSPPQEPSRRP